MRDLDLLVIRVGEFTWSVMKPRKGKYDFSLFDFFLEDVYKRKGMTLEQERKTRKCGKKR